MEHADWPALPYDEWAPTRRTLHLTSQMLGKVKLALAPPQPEWLHARLFLDARGIATGAIPCGTRTVGTGIDLLTSSLWLSTSDGRQQSIALTPDRSVADVWSGFRHALADLDVRGVGKLANALATARHRANRLASLDQCLDDLAPQQAGGAGHEDGHRVLRPEA